jgi:uncharacterized protein
LLKQSIPADGGFLLFFDEIQAAPEVLAKLRWFAEELPSLPVIAAGSLLDFTVADHRFSMPVGRISYLHLEPMGFREFCLALGEDALVRWMREEVSLERIMAGTAMPAPLHDQAQQLFRAWILVGGMPAAVEAYRVQRSFLPVSDLHRELLATFRDDFAKYADRVHHRRLLAVLDSVPAQLGQKFMYTRVDRDERTAALRQALELLTLARACHRVIATPARGLPLGAGADDRTFKVIHLDIGLAATGLRLDAAQLESADDLIVINAGAVAEQAVGQLLRLTVASNEDPALWYWQRESRYAQAEIDYLSSAGGRVLPIEVKSGAGGALKSLHLFMAERGLPWAVRLNSMPPVVQDVDVMTTSGQRVRYRLLSLPMYLTEELARFSIETER